MNHERQAIEEWLKILEESYPKEPKLIPITEGVRDAANKLANREIEAQQSLQEYAEAYEKLTSPANRIGVFITFQEENALIALGDNQYLAKIDPKFKSQDELKPGRQVVLSESFAVINWMPENTNGPTVKVAELLPDGRLRSGAEPNSPGAKFFVLADCLQGREIKEGDEVRIETTGHFAVEHFPHQESRDYFIEEVPEVPWSAIGGQEEALKVIRNTIEQPLLHPEIYEKFNKKPVKGILLYGPPGCGKTLIGKATAYNLAKEVSERKGKAVKECFLHISGPKILNMWLGETERMVREIFALARRKSKEGELVVVFIDEAESILRTRSSGKWLSISNTVVPQFCAEMDGLLGLENVVVILTSNRPDYIDPAILRPERIDRKVKIRRPDHESTRQILNIYLDESLPIDPKFIKEHDNEPSCARKALIESALAYLWQKSKDHEFLRVHLKNGSDETLYFKDLVSGALIKSVVDRAKDFAIQRAIENPKSVPGLLPEDLIQAITAEYQENEIFPKSDVMEDWLKLIDLEPESVASIKPIRATQASDHFRKTII